MFQRIQLLHMLYMYVQSALKRLYTVKTTDCLYRNKLKGLYHYAMCNFVFEIEVVKNQLLDFRDALVKP